MAKDKKKMSKNAKAAAKILNNSKLLAVKNANDTKNPQNTNATIATPKISAANKMRPEKKRG